MEIRRAFEILLDLSRIHKNGINSASEVESGKMVIYTILVFGLSTL